MKLRQRLALYFTLLTTAVLSVMLPVTWLNFKSQLSLDFYDKLQDRAEAFAAIQLENSRQPQGAGAQPARLDRLSSLPSEVLRMYNSAGQQVFVIDSNQYWSQATINRVKQAKQLQFADGHIQVYGKTITAPSGLYVVIASAQDEEGEHKLSLLAQAMAVAFALSIALAYIGGVWLAQYLLKPLQVLVQHVKGLNAEKLNQPLTPINPADEVGILVIEFNRLLSHLQKAFELQQTYNVNASHELRTPITAIIGNAEVALQKPRTPNEYRQVLEDILAEAGNLKSTVNALLQLSVVEMGIAHINYTQLRTDELMFELADVWNKRLYPGALQVKIPLLPQNEAELCFMAEKDLALIALNNIIGNGFKYSANKPVTLTLGLQPGSVSISVTDTGTGIPAADLPHLQQAFYRSNHNKHVSGTGLGLYVAGTIISLFKGTINFTTAPTGTTVTILLPAAVQF